MFKKCYLTCSIVTTLVLASFASPKFMAEEIEESPSKSTLSVDVLSEGQESDNVIDNKLIETDNTKIDRENSESNKISSNELNQADENKIDGEINEEYKLSQEDETNETSKVGENNSETEDNDIEAKEDENLADENNREDNTDNEENDAKDSENTEQVGFFIDEFGNTKYRIPDTKELFKGGILEIQNEAELVKYVFDLNGNLVEEDFVSLEDGSLVYAKLEGKLLDEIGLVSIDRDKYIFKDDNSVLLDDWYDLDDNRVYAAPKTGKLYTRGAFTVKDGVRYAFDEDGYLAKGKWVDEPGYGRSYGRPSDGAAYRLGAYTVHDGKRYVFNGYGILAKGEWVDEPGYGREYGRPSDGVAYSLGAYTLHDGKRYVFNKYGILARGEWVDEPGYGREYGRASNGVAYSQGAYTLHDGKRYVFNRYGVLAKGQWVDEPGYGREYGRPSDGVAYSGGAFTLHDGYRYAFNNYGVLAKGEWVYEKGYGKTYGDPITGRTYHSGAYFIKEGNNYEPYVFNEIGYLQTREGWILNKEYGWTYALNNGKPYRNAIKRINNSLYAFGNNGYLANGYKSSNKASFSNRLKYKNVDLIIQNPELPNGCEITSLAIALSSLGQKVDKMDLYNSSLSKVNFYRDGYRTYAASPENAYVGNAGGYGWYCFEEPIIEAGDYYLKKNNLEAKMKLQSGLSMADLDELLKANCPVISWVTLNYSNPRYSSASWYLPDGTHYLPYSNLHCVVLAGVKGNNYLVANPIDGWQYVNKSRFWNAFDKMGRRAVIVD